MVQSSHGANAWHPADREIYRTTLNAYIAEGDAYFSINFRMRNPEGEYDWLSLTATICVR